MSKSYSIAPTLLLVPREAETDSSGCVSCPDGAPSCPTCDKDETCAVTTQTCSKCPETYCQKSVGHGNSSGGSTNIGGIVGGVIGGLVAIGVLLYLFYRFYFKKRLAFNRVQQKEYYFDDDIEINFHHNLPPDDPLQQNSSRASLATVFTRASNIIPIAYIPGVTIGTNKSNNRISTVSEVGTIDSEMIGDRFSQASIVGNPASTTTAIRARPKLVTVSSNGGAQDPNSNVPNTAVSPEKLGGVRAVKVERKPVGLQSDLIEEEEEEEEEKLKERQDEITKDNVDTFIGTAVTLDDATGTNFTTDDYEPFIIDDGEENEQEDDVKSQGSFTLEVEMDRPNIDPFDDSNSTDKENTPKLD